MTKLSKVLIGTGGVTFVHRQLGIIPFLLFNYNKIHRQLAISLTFMFFQALITFETL